MMTDEIAAAHRSPWLMNVDDTLLLVIDLQQKLVPLVRDSAEMLENVTRLVEAAQVCGIPIVATEQYPQGLGETVEPLRSRLPAAMPKLSFSCCGEDDILAALTATKRRKIAVCGIEAHICVQQTVLDLIANGFDVYVPVDAISARFKLDHRLALTRMDRGGAALTSTEAVLFEWCSKAGTPQFKSLSAIVRQRTPRSPAV